MLQWSCCPPAAFGQVGTEQPPAPSTCEMQVNAVPVRCQGRPSSMAHLPAWPPESAGGAAPHWARPLPGGAPQQPPALQSQRATGGSTCRAEAARLKTHDSGFFAESGGHKTAATTRPPVLRVCMSRTSGLCLEVEVHRVSCCSSCCRLLRPSEPCTSVRPTPTYGPDRTDGPSCMLALSRTSALVPLVQPWQGFIWLDPQFAQETASLLDHLHAQSPSYSAPPPGSTSSPK